MVPLSGPGEPDRVRVTERLAPEPLEALAGLVGSDVPRTTVPALWHVVLLLERRPHADLGPDGHPLGGVPAPPGPGRRRMFAGGRVRTRRLLALGEEAIRDSRVVDSVEKQGRTGPLTFVTVRHEISQGGEVCVVEDHDIVYRAAEGGVLPPAAAEPMPQRSPALVLDVDEALLFRYSALTYNAHRIHYDHRWARHEGYDDLVVHGPLQVLMMGELQRRHGAGLLGATFAYRLVAPMVGPQTLSVLPAVEGLGSGAEVRDGRGVVTATSSLSPGTAG